MKGTRGPSPPSGPSGLSLRRQLQARRVPTTWSDRVGEGSADQCSRGGSTAPAAPPLGGTIGRVLRDVHEGVLLFIHVGCRCVRWGSSCGTFPHGRSKTLSGLRLEWASRTGKPTHARRAATSRYRITPTSGLGPETAPEATGTAKCGHCGGEPDSQTRL